MIYFERKWGIILLPKQLNFLKLTQEKTGKLCSSARKKLNYTLRLFSGLVPWFWNFYRKIPLAKNIHHWLSVLYLNMEHSCSGWGWLCGADHADHAAVKPGVIWSDQTDWRTDRQTNRLTDGRTQPIEMHLKWHQFKFTHEIDTNSNLLMKLIYLRI